MSATVAAVVACFATVGCDDSTDGTGGNATTSSGTQSTGSNMSTTGSMGTGSSSSTGISASAWDMYCDARAALNCPGSTFSAAACKTQQACATGLLKDAIEADLIDCLSKNCSEDDCLAATLTEPLTSEGMNFSSSCQTWVTNCMAGDDICAGAYFLEDDDLMTLNGCLSMGNCPDKQACVDAFNTSIDTCQAWL